MAQAASAHTLIRRAPQRPRTTSPSTHHQTRNRMQWFAERDVVDTTRAAMMRGLLEGQFDAPFRVIEFTLGGTCAHDAAEEIAGKVAQRTVGEGLAIPPRRRSSANEGASIRPWRREGVAAMVNRLVHKVETVESQFFETVGRLLDILREAKMSSTGLRHDLCRGTPLRDVKRRSQQYELRIRSAEAEAA